MVRRECGRERELLEAVACGLWSARADDELHAHVAGCAACSDLARVATALVRDRRSAIESAAVPGSGLVWWRMQMRARRDRTVVATRTASSVQAGVLAGALGVALAVFAFAALPSVAQAGALGASGLRWLASWGLPLLLAVGAWLALTPVAVWLAVTEE